VEKVINEFRVIETDDGFRIEIKGDKEAIRRMLRGFGPHGFGGAGGPFGRDFPFGFGAGFWGGCGDWWGSQPKTGEEKDKA
jgi:hypothetical protein